MSQISEADGGPEIITGTVPDVSAYLPALHLISIPDFWMSGNKDFEGFDLCE